VERKNKQAEQELIEEEAEEPVRKRKKMAPSDGPRDAQDDKAGALGKRIHKQELVIAALKKGLNEQERTIAMIVAMLYALMQHGRERA
jgi:hypothetical protein